MKKLLLCTIALAALMLVGCKSSYPVAMQTGVEDQAYLVFVRRHLKVTFRGKTLYDKEVFLSNQETKVINLP